MYDKVKNDFRLDEKNSLMLLHLLDHMCIALMGEVYQTGSCGAYASIALMECLKAGMPAEYIQLNQSERSNHAIVALGRSGIYEQDMKTWGPFTMIDGWADTCVDFKSSPTSKELCPFFDKIKSTYFKVKIERLIRKEEWEELIKFLNYLKNFNEENFTIFLQTRSNPQNVNVKKELEMIHKKINEFINEFTKVALKAPSTHITIFCSPSSDFMRLKVIKQMVGKEIIVDKETHQVSFSLNWLAQVKKFNPEGITELRKILEVSEFTLKM